MSKQSTASNSGSQSVDNVQQISDAAVAAANAASREAKSIVGNSFLALKNSAAFAWHTWLGAAVVAEEFAVKQVKGFANRGEKFEGQARKKLSQQVDKAASSTEGLRKQARKRLTDMEGLLERGTNRSLHFLRVPTRNDVDKLTDLIQELTDSVNDLAEKTVGEEIKGNSARAKKSTVNATTA